MPRIRFRDQRRPRGKWASLLSDILHSLCCAGPLLPTADTIDRLSPRLPHSVLPPDFGEIDYPAAPRL